VCGVGSVSSSNWLRVTRQASCLHRAAPSGCLVGQIGCRADALASKQPIAGCNFESMRAGARGRQFGVDQLCVWQLCDGQHLDWHLVISFARHCPLSVVRKGGRPLGGENEIAEFIRVILLEVNALFRAPQLLGFAAIILGGATDGSTSAAPVAAWMSLPSSFLAVGFFPQWQNDAGSAFCLFLSLRSAE
jgi:hypothetical protein